MKIVCKLKLVKVTKGALKYEQTHQGDQPVMEGGSGDAAGLIGSMYVRKAYMPGEQRTITVTVEAE